MAPAKGGAKITELLAAPELDFLSLIIIIIVSFKVDTLEIAMKEQLDMVDHVFIVESALSHKGVKHKFEGEV